MNDPFFEISKSIHVFVSLDLSFSRDGKRLVSAGLDGEAKVWSIDDGREVVTFPGMTVDFSPDGNVLAVGGLLKLPFGTSELSSSVRLYRAPFEQIDRASVRRQFRKRSAWRQSVGAAVPAKQ